MIIINVMMNTIHFDWGNNDNIPNVAEMDSNMGFYGNNLSGDIWKNLFS